MSALAFAAALVIASAPATTGTGDPAVAAEAAVRAEFAAICRRFRHDETGDDPYFGQRVVAELEKRLAAPIASPEVRVGVRARLGVELLRLGRNDEALARLAEARTLAAEHGLGEALRLQLDRDLALAHLRAAETENCVVHAKHAGHAAHGAASCILPIAPEAVHRRPAHARAAGDLYAGYLERRHDAPEVRWLLNLARMTSGDYPAGVPAPLRVPAEQLAAGDAASTPWRDVAPALGVAAVDLAGGAVMDDFDGDGLLDLITSTNDPCGPLQAFRNDGRGGFEDVAAAWGLDAQLGGLNLVHGDVDGDGRLDLLVLRGGWWLDHGEIRNSLLHNDLGGSDASGRFVDITAAAGLATPAYPTQTAAFADADGDGDLDLYIGAEATPQRPHRSQLLRNLGPESPGGPPVRFEDVTDAAGVANLRYAKGVAWGDVDEDGDPDLYVSNLGAANRLYRNDSAHDSPGGALRFVDIAAEAGVTGPAASFATFFFDADQDGRLDLFVADYGTSYPRVAASYLGIDAGGGTANGGHPVLYRNEGVPPDSEDGGAVPRLRDVSAAAGLTRPLLPMGANHGDLDNDGRPDVYLGTGVPDYEALLPNVMLRGGGGPGAPRFADVTFGLGFGHLQKGHGVAWGDLDNDGDQDLLHQLGGQYPGDVYQNALFENPGAGNRWLALDLVGVRANRFAIGARLAVEVRTASGTRRTIHVLAGSGGSFGGSSLRQEIGLGDAVAIERLRVRWPGSGLEQVVEGLALDRFYRLREGGAPEPLALPALRLGGETTAGDDGSR